MDPVGRFCTWFTDAAFRLRALPIHEALDVIYDELKKVNAGLSVELGDHAQLRELVLSANGHSELFELVRGIKARLGATPGWLVTALKPPKGFDFVHTTPEGGRIEAAELFFEPLQTNETPSRIVIRVFLPAEMVAYEDVEWMLRVLAETGIGEERCSHIAFFEAAPEASTPHDALPIEVLGDYVAHVLKIRHN